MTTSNQNSIDLSHFTCTSGLLVAKQKASELQSVERMKNVCEQSRLYRA